MAERDIVTGHPDNTFRPEQLADQPAAQYVVGR
ncbi:hypothetical protein PN499_20220 [Kamptonema animale CS-326]|nr:hypothetical protein [Kamptonema animale]MDB9513526.1 hypothetical protein [Kamptonema animale CS-326]